MSSPIRCQALTKKFRRSLAIDNLHLEVPEESIYGLIGPNGAGKTTLIKMLANLLQPSAGKAIVLDTDSRRLAPRHFTRIGYVSENQELPEWMTVQYFLSYLKPFYPDWDDSLANDMLREFELPQGRKIGQLSRGMKMKVALASSLAYRPRLLLLDEPFSGLDPLVRDEFVRGLLSRAEGATVLISSHDLSELETFASHIGFLDDGKMRFSEEVATLSGRFRAVEIGFATAPALPTPWPTHWLGPQTSPTLIRFIETNFSESETPAGIRQLFPGADTISADPMPLRDIFVAVAKARNKKRGDAA